MKLGEVGEGRSSLGTHILASDRIWARPIDKVSEGEITLFYARAGLANRTLAANAIDKVQSALVRMANKGNLANAPIALILHEVPPDPYFVDELVDGLKVLGQVRARAVLFALDTGNSPHFVEHLTWATAQQLKGLSALSEEILAESKGIRFLGLDRVFWVWCDDHCAKGLNKLEASIERHMGCTWPELAEKYSRIVKLHRANEATSFLALLQNIDQAD